MAVSRVSAEAHRLRAWAEEAGVFSQGRASASVTPQDALAGNVMFGAGAAHTFAVKPITAIGYAHSERRPPRIFIYTRRKLTKGEEAELAANTKLEHPVEFRVAQPFSVTIPSHGATFPTMFRNGRLTCGSSISIGNDRCAGTIGALLRNEAGELFGLSCNHVAGGCSNAQMRAPIVAPGILDVGPNAPDPRTIGHHHSSLPFVQGEPSTVPSYKRNSDAAVFSIADEANVTSWQGGAYDTPVAVEDPEEDAPVEKVGRSSHHTKGIIESRLVGPLRLDYQATTYHSAEENVVFRGSVFFEPVFIVRGVEETFAMEGGFRRPDRPARAGRSRGGGRRRPADRGPSAAGNVHAHAQTRVGGAQNGPCQRARLMHLRFGGKILILTGTTNHEQGSWRTAPIKRALKYARSCFGILAPRSAAS